MRCVESSYGLRTDGNHALVSSGRQVCYIGVSETLVWNRGWRWCRWWDSEQSCSSQARRTRQTASVAAAADDFRPVTSPGRRDQVWQLWDDDDNVTWSRCNIYGQSLTCVAIMSRLLLFVSNLGGYDANQLWQLWGEDATSSSLGSANKGTVAHLAMTSPGRRRRTAASSRRSWPWQFRGRGMPVSPWRVQSVSAGGSPSLPMVLRLWRWSFVSAGGPPFLPVVRRLRRWSSVWVVLRLCR